MLFNEIIAVYTDNHDNVQIQSTKLLIINADGRYSCHSALKG
jgi:hypothetical protein